MDMQLYARQRETQLLKEISGLDGQLAEIRGVSDKSRRCVNSYLKQLMKSKRQKLAALRYQRSGSV
jgi:hypothetical protein